MKKAPLDVVEPTVCRAHGREIYRHPAYGQMTVSRTTGERVLNRFAVDVLGNDRRSDRGAQRIIREAEERLGSALRY